jgi:hypothetical protein
MNQADSSEFNGARASASAAAAVGRLARPIKRPYAHVALKARRLFIGLICRRRSFLIACQMAVHHGARSFCGSVMLCCVGLRRCRACAIQTRASSCCCCCCCCSLKFAAWSKARRARESSCPSGTRARARLGALPTASLVAAASIGLDWCDFFISSRA